MILRSSNRRFIVLIPCAGVGMRFGGDVPKQYIQINSKTILEHTVDKFKCLDIISQVIIICSVEDSYIDVISPCLGPTVKIMKVGGVTRSESVKNGLLQLKCSSRDWIIVHDAVRCCVTSESILSMINNLAFDEVGGVFALEATDTVKYSNDRVVVENTLDRSKIFLVQTPQMFRYGVLIKSVLTQQNYVESFTDESSAVEKMGLKVKILAGNRSNIKVTYPEDIVLAKALLTAK